MQLGHRDCRAATMTQLILLIALFAFCSCVMRCTAAGPLPATASSSAAQPALTTRASRDGRPSEPQKTAYGPYEKNLVSMKHSARSPAAYQPGKQQQDRGMRYHGTQQLLVLSNIIFLPLTNTAGKSVPLNTNSNSSRTQQQEPSQTACLKIRAVLSAVGQRHRQCVKRQTDHSHRPYSNSAQHSQQQQSIRNVHAADSSRSTATTDNQADIHTEPSPPPPTVAFTSQDGAAATRTHEVCRQQHPAHVSGVAAAEPADHHVALLVPIKPHAAAAVDFITSNSHASTGNEAAAERARLLLILYAEQHVAGQAYLWTGSQLLAEDDGIVNIDIDMRQYAYTWAVLPPPTAATGHLPMNATIRSHACTPAVDSPQQQPAAAQKTQHIAGHSISATEPARNVSNSIHQATAQQEPSPAQAAHVLASTSSTCPSLKQLLQTHAAWSPSGAAYAVAAFLDAHSDHKQWAGQALAGAGASSTSGFSLNELSNEDSSSKLACPIWLPQFSSQGRCTVAEATVLDNTTNDELVPTVQMFTWDHSNSIIIQLSQQQQLFITTAAIAAAVLLFAFLMSKASIRPATATPAVAAAAAANTAPEPVLQSALHEAALCAQQCDLPDIVNHWESRDQTDEPTGSAPDDPFGYGSSAAAPGSHPTGPAASHQAPIAGMAAATAAVRRASAMAAGHAAGTLKAAFANRAAAYPTVMATAGAAAVAGTGISGGYPAVGPNTAAKANVAYWDNADEEAVNQLPASIQAHLQAAGRWTRDKGGRLVRGSMRALRAASIMAAGALAQAAGSGSVAAAGAAQAIAGQVSGRVAEDSGRETSSGDAALLRRLMVAGPGAELVLSDDEA